MGSGAAEDAAADADAESTTRGGAGAGAALAGAVGAPPHADIVHTTTAAESHLRMRRSVTRSPDAVNLRGVALARTIG